MCIRDSRCPFHPQPSMESPMSNFAISAQHLARSFGETHALVDVSLDIPAGSVCALLGRNGAGLSLIHI